MNFHPAWDDQAGTTAWENYTDALLRQVAAKALKTRQKLSAADLRLYAAKRGGRRRVVSCNS